MVFIFTIYALDLTLSLITEQFLLAKSVDALLRDKPKPKEIAQVSKINYFIVDHRTPGVYLLC
jgi:hypothetical protein